jgi:hypothetical protein
MHVMQRAKRFNWLSAGRRWRKTTMVMAIAVEHAVQGAQIMWCAPTYEQARVAMEETAYAARDIAVFNESRMTAAFPSGGRIAYRSLQKPDNVRSFTAHGIVIDEVADVPEEAWTAVLRPTLISTRGWMWGIGTPKGRNWFYAQWHRAAERGDAAAFRAPTLGAEVVGGRLVRKPHPLENPTVDWDEIEQLHRTMPEYVFRQEILAEFVEVGGGVFRGVRDAVRPAAMHSYTHTHVAGLDWALNFDYTVLTIIDATTGAVVHVDRFNGVEYAMQRARIAAACQRFRVDVLLAEANAMGKPNNDMLRDEGVPVRDFTTTSSTKSEIIRRLAAAFEQRRLTLPTDDVMIAELEAYEAKRLESGAIRYSAPDGMHDDTVMSLALAWYAADTTTAAVAPMIARSPF